MTVSSELHSSMASSLVSCRPSVAGSGLPLRGLGPAEGPGLSRRIKTKRDTGRPVCTKAYAAL